MTNDELVVAARQLITERSEAQVNITRPRLYALIPTALYEFRRWIKDRPDDRKLLESTQSVSFSGGTADLTSYVNGTTASIDLHDLQNQTLYDASSPKKPLTWVASRQQLQHARQLDSTYSAVFLDGKILRVRNAADGLLTSFADSVTFEAVSYPTQMADVPSVLAEQVVEILAALAIRGGMVDGSS